MDESCIYQPLLNFRRNSIRKTTRKNTVKIQTFITIDGISSSC